MKICNNDIRLAAESKGIRLWQIASHLSVNDGNFSRRLRMELPATEKQRIFEIIEEISKEVG